MGEIHIAPQQTKVQKSIQQKFRNSSIDECLEIHVGDQFRFRNPTKNKSKSTGQIQIEIYTGHISIFCLQLSICRSNKSQNQNPNRKNHNLISKKSVNREVFGSKASIPERFQFKQPRNRNPETFVRIAAQATEMVSIVFMKGDKEGCFRQKPSLLQPDNFWGGLRQPKNNQGEAPPCVEAKRG